MATISAWALGSWRPIGALKPLPMTSPSRTSTAPTGTSPRSAPRRACSRARAMKCSSRERSMIGRILLMRSIAVVLPALAASLVDHRQTLLQGRLGMDLGAHRGGDEQEESDQQLMQAQSLLLHTEEQRRGEDDAAHPEGGGRGGRVQAGEEVRQPVQADGADQREGAA